MAKIPPQAEVSAAGDMQRRMARAPGASSLCCHSCLHDECCLHSSIAVMQDVWNKLTQW